MFWFNLPARLSDSVAITKIYNLSEFYRLNVVVGHDSESNNFNNLSTLEIPKQDRDDNCDTVCLSFRQTRFDQHRQFTEYNRINCRAQFAL